MVKILPKPGGSYLVQTPPAGQQHIPSCHQEEMVEV